MTFLLFIFLISQKCGRTRDSPQSSHRSGRIQHSKCQTPQKCWSLTTLDSQDPKTSNLAMRYANSKNEILNQEMAGVYQ